MQLLMLIICQSGAKKSQSLLALQLSCPVGYCASLVSWALLHWDAIKIANCAGKSTWLSSKSGINNSAVNFVVYRYELGVLNEVIDMIQCITVDGSIYVKGLLEDLSRLSFSFWPCSSDAQVS